MNGQTVLVVVLAVVAIATTVQAAALVGVLLSLRRLEGRLGEAERELRALRPRLERLGQMIDNVADWTDAVAERAPRVAADLERTLDQLRGIARLGALMLVKPSAPARPGPRCLEGPQGSQGLPPRPCGQGSARRRRAGGRGRRLKAVRP